MTDSFSNNLILNFYEAASAKTTGHSSMRTTAKLMQSERSHEGQGCGYRSDRTHAARSPMHCTILYSGVFLATKGCNEISPEWRYQLDVALKKRKANASTVKASRAEQLPMPVCNKGRVLLTTLLQATSLLHGCSKPRYQQLDF